MKIQLLRALRRFCLPGRVALASLVLLGLFCPPAALAGGGSPAPNPALAGPSAGGSGTGGKAAEPSDGMFGWYFGSPSINAPWVCGECLCLFTGPASTVNTPPKGSCRVESEIVISIQCPGSVTPGCPNGVTGQMKIVTYGCCASVAGASYCMTQTVTLYSC